MDADECGVIMGSYSILYCVTFLQHVFLKRFYYWKVIDCGNPTANLSNEYKRHETGSVPPFTYYTFTNNIQCMVGYKFADSSSVNTITCDASGKWTASPICNRKFNVNDFINLL